MQNKPFLLYKAFGEAVDNFNTRHNLKRQYLADEIGYIGKNSSILFSNALNPNSTTGLSDEKKCSLLHSLDEEARVVFFEEFMRQFGLRPTKLSAPKFDCTIVKFSQMVDLAQMDSDDSWRVSKMALQDGKLEESELEEIIRSTKQSIKRYEEILHLAGVKLSEVRVGEEL